MSMEDKKLWYDRTVNLARENGLETVISVNQHDDPPVIETVVKGTVNNFVIHGTIIIDHLGSFSGEVIARSGEFYKKFGNSWSWHDFYSHMLEALNLLKHPYEEVLINRLEKKIAQKEYDINFCEKATKEHPYNEAYPRQMEKYKMELDELKGKVDRIKREMERKDAPVEKIERVLSRARPPSIGDRS